MADRQQKPLDAQDPELAESLEEYLREHGHEEEAYPHQVLGGDPHT